MTIDTGKLQEFLGRFIADLGAALAAGNVVIGHRLGLHQVLAAEPLPLAKSGSPDPVHRQAGQTATDRLETSGGYARYFP